MEQAEPTYDKNIKQWFVRVYDKDLKLVSIIYASTKLKALKRATRFVLVPMMSAVINELHKEDRKKWPDYNSADIEPELIDFLHKRLK